MKTLLWLVCIGLPTMLWGQTDTTGHMDRTRVKEMNHSMHHEMGDRTESQDQPQIGMTHLYSRNLPMNRNGSGTTWHPDATPMYAYMAHKAKWMYMLHYSVFLRYTSQNVNNPVGRGRENSFNAPNWAMGMAQRLVGKRGLLAFKAMLSLDPFTVEANGYPLLFQTGESYKGQPLIDRQHQHDLFSELSVGYSHTFSTDADAFLYVGLPGEPALGPPAFMHRISSFNIIDAPLGHHWMDATHITFGVATADFRYKIAKLEVSSFTGREPDERRLGFDRPRFDSYSYRLSINPTPTLAFQVSQGRIHSPDAINPEDNVTRTTASVLHSKRLGSSERYITSAVVWGLNSHYGEKENAYLAETSIQLGRLAVFGRYENIMKSREELRLANRSEPLKPLLNVDNVTVGTNYRLVRLVHTDVVVGGQVTVSLPDKGLQPYYGTMPLSGQVYIRITPSLITMN